MVFNLCYYITSTLPEKTNLDDLKPIFVEFNMDFSPIENKKIKSQLRPGDLYLRATKDYCDCDSVLGSNNPLQQYQKLIKSKKVKTLKKKGCTNEQIQNWIRGKIKSKLHKSSRKKVPIEVNQEIEKWIKFIINLLETYNLKRIGLLKHWYKLGIENEDFNIKGTKRIPINEINSEFLLKLEEDVLYEFIPNYQS